MSDDSISVNVRILDKEYTITCPPEDREGLMASARELNKRMQELRTSGMVLGAERMAVLTALNVIYEREQLDSNRGGALDLAQDAIRRLENKLDTAIGRREDNQPLDS